MKTRLIALLSIFSMFLVPALAERKSSNVMSSVKEGKYNESDRLTVGKLRYLPVPNTKEDYVILQSIGKVTSLVIGHFKDSAREIIILTDKDSDGKVDSGKVYDFDENKITNIPNVATEYPPDKFRKMKLDVMNGVRGSVFPNPEGAIYLKKMLEDKTGMVKKSRHNNGFRIYVNDPDEPSRFRAVFYYSDNRKGSGGVDLAFELMYNNIGNQMVSPVISYNVYCRGSFDEVVTEMVEDLSKFTVSHFND
jgi:hypothetical protein